MGTFYTLHFHSSESLNIDVLANEIEKVLTGFNDQLSNWNPESWISHFNALPANQEISIPHHALQVLTLSMELAERSNGALDPTISPLVELWGFGTRRHDTIPTQSQISRTLSRIGYRKIQLDTGKKTAVKSANDVQLNCSAVAKGYAVDLIAEHLHSRGIDNFLINIGGEVRAAGSPIDKVNWTVGIEHYSSINNEGIPLTNRAMATSGHSQRAYLVDGVRYSHILNPQTGRPTPARIASATVLAPTCALADGLATLALIIPRDEFISLINNYKDVETIYTPWPRTSD